MLLSYQKFIEKDASAIDNYHAHPQANLLKLTVGRIKTVFTKNTTILIQPSDQETINTTIRSRNNQSSKCTTSKSCVSTL